MFPRRRACLARHECWCPGAVTDQLGFGVIVHLLSLDGDILSLSAFNVFHSLQRSSIHAETVLLAGGFASIIFLPLLDLLARYFPVVIFPSRPKKIATSLYLKIIII